MVSGDLLTSIKTASLLFPTSKSAKANVEGDGAFAEVINQCNAEENQDKIDEIQMNLVATMMGSGYINSSIDMPVDGEVIPDSENLQAISQISNEIVDTSVNDMELVDLKEEVQKFNIEIPNLSEINVDEESADISNVIRVNSNTTVNSAQGNIPYTSIKFSANNIQSNKLDNQMQNIVDNILQVYSDGQEDNTNELVISSKDDNLVSNVNIEKNIDFQYSIAADTTITKIDIVKNQKLNSVNVSGEEMVDVSDVELNISKISNQSSENSSFFEEGEQSQNSNQMEMDKNKIPGEVALNNVTFSVNSNNNVHGFKIQNVEDPTNELNKMIENVFTKTTFLTDADGNSQMEIQLQPENLGKIIIKLQTTDGVMNIKISATDTGVKDALTTQIVNIQTAIKEQGIQLNNIEINQSNLADYLENGQEHQSAYQEPKKQNNDNTDDTSYVDFLSTLDEGQINGILQHNNLEITV